MNKLLLAVVAIALNTSAFAYPKANTNNVVIQPVIQATTAPWSFEIVSEPEILPIIPEKPIQVKVEKIKEVTVTDYDISADLLFAFDKYTIKDKDKKFLSEIVDHINQTYQQIDQIIVVGHTDRLGSDSYNLDLSNKRANTVRTELVNYGIPSQLIISKGKGETQPVTNGCKDVKPYSAMKACLQPDRRVSIRVEGKALEVKQEVVQPVK